MIPEIREQFNASFDHAVYRTFIQDINQSHQNSLDFRVAESPLFLTDDLTAKLIEAADQVISVIRQPGYPQKVQNAIPPGMSVANEDEHPVFVQVDFAICRDNNNAYIPRLIELQGFPTIYCFQHYLDEKIHQYFEMPKGFTPFFSSLDGMSYKNLLKKVLLGESDPENVVLLELEPWKQKTRIDFYLTEKYFGIKPVCITKVLHRGRKLYYRSDAKEIPIERIYHRFIFDDLVRKNIQCSFDFEDHNLDVHWVGHPNWFFKVSKYTLPFIKSRYCPPCYFLGHLTEYPDHLENYVLKPLFSFAGTGVSVNVNAELLDNLPGRENYILQQKVEYTPVMKTPDGYAKAEVRMMLIWDKEPKQVNNLLRLSKGKMMGVDYNKNKTWVGSSLAYHRPMTNRAFNNGTSR